MLKVFSHLEDLMPYLDLNKSNNIDRISNALQKGVEKTEISINFGDFSYEEIEDPYRNTPLSAVTLYRALNNPDISLADLMLILSPINTFSYFDQRHWMQLRTLFSDDERSQKAIAALLYQWLKSHPTDAQSAQARLFLLSQNFFDMEKAGYDLIADPILASDDDWAILALLSSTTFDLKRYKNHDVDVKLRGVAQRITRTQTNHHYIYLPSDEAKSTLWAFVRYSGIGDEEKSVLLENIITLLDINGADLNFAQEDIITFIKISSQSGKLNEKVIGFVSQLSFNLIRDWNLDATNEEKESFEKPKKKFITLLEKIEKKCEDSESPIEKIIFDDFTENLQTLRNIGVKMIDNTMSIWLPGTGDDEKILKELKLIWNYIEVNKENVLEKLYQEGLTKSFDDARKFKAESHMRLLLLFIATPGMFDRLIKIDNSEAIKNKINESLDVGYTLFFGGFFNALWDRKNYFNRRCSDEVINWLFDLNAFKSFKFLEHSQHHLSLKTIFQSKDDYFIEKLFGLGKDLRTSPVFEAIVKMGFEEKKEDFGCEMIAKRLLKDPGFEIMHFYTKSSETFQNLPSVRTAYQLASIFYAIHELNLNYDKNSFDEDILLSELNGRYREMLVSMVNASNISTESAFVSSSFNKIEKIFKLLKHVDSVKRKGFYAQPGLTEFLLTYRINEKKETSKKRVFLECVRVFSKFPQIVPENYLFLQLAYKYINEKDNIKFILNQVYTSSSEREKNAALSVLYKVLSSASQQSMAEIDRYFNELIFGKSTKISKTEETLVLLSDDFLDQIFSGSTLRARFIHEERDADSLLHSSSSDEGREHISSANSGGSMSIFSRVQSFAGMSLRRLSQSSDPGAGNNIEKPKP